MSVMVGGAPDRAVLQGRATVAAPGEPDTFQAMRDFLRRHWVGIVATTLVVTVLAVVGVQLIAPRYAARADVLLDPRRDKAFGPDDVAGTISLDTASVAALCRKRTRT